MSKQLTLSSTLAVLAMAGLALLTSVHGSIDSDQPARNAAAGFEIEAKVT